MLDTFNVYIKLDQEIFISVEISFLRCMVAHTSNPNTWKAEAVRFQSPGLER